MSESKSLRDFLVSRRARIDPDSVGLPPSPTPRRSRGLRREEVAALAGVSVDYYARLEQGRIGQVSDQVLTAIEDALRLDPLERRHLRALVEAIPAKARRARPDRLTVRPGLRALIEAMDPVPAFLQGPRMEVLASNRAARTVLTDFEALPLRERNIARWLFLSPEARVRFPQWEDVAAPTVAALRAARDPRVPDPALERLVGELSVASTDFARWWADYRLFQHGHGRKELYHDVVGSFTISYETLAIDGSDGQVLTTYTADAGSPSDEKLKLLLSWSADGGPGASDAVARPTSETDWSRRT